MDIYTRWAFNNGRGALQKIFLAEFLDLCDEDFYVSGKDFRALVKKHGNPASYKTLKTLQEKNLIYIKREAKSRRIEWIKVLYPQIP